MGGGGGSSKNAVHLLESLEYGTNYAYQLHLKNEAQLFEKPLKMSILTKKILSSLEYGQIKARRLENFEYLHSRLKEKNLFTIRQATDTAYSYPFLICDDTARNKLLNDKIYISQLWKPILDTVPCDTLEYYLSKYLLPLPIDQRYNRHDMETMCNRIVYLLDLQ